MTPDLQDQLFKLAPRLYRDRDSMDGLMIYGLCVDDGWFDILRDLSVALEAEINRTDSNAIAAQVKEKFGGLRVYVDGASVEMQQLIDDAESASLKTCELCGQPGSRYGKAWIKTMCADCIASWERQR